MTGRRVTCIIILRDQHLDTLRDLVAGRDGASLKETPGRGNYTICMLNVSDGERRWLMENTPQPPNGMWLAAFAPLRLPEPGVGAAEWQARAAAFLQVHPFPRDPETGAPLPPRTLIREALQDLGEWYGEGVPVEDEEPEE